MKIIPIWKPEALSECLVNWINVELPDRCVIAVDEKSNEITAVPELLDLLYIDNTIITADSMSCQKKIIDAGAEYCIALKGSQPMLCQNVEDYFCAYAGEASTDKHLEKGHGKIEIREYYLSCDIGWMEQEEEWEELKAIGMVKSRVIEGEKESEVTIHGYSKQHAKNLPAKLSGLRSASARAKQASLALSTAAKTAAYVFLMTVKFYQYLTVFLHSL